MRNTTQVNYCVIFDSASLTITQTAAETAIVDAVNYWKADFKRSITGGGGFAELGTQNFVLQSKCQADTDIKFKFGYGSLTADEAKYLGDPQKYIGVSVRTSGYDTVNLKASGFVFMSSDTGLKSYENPGHLIDRAWEKPNLLKFALVHEMGHIFGIPHSGTGLMSEVFMDHLLHKRFYQDFVKGDVISYLNPPTEFKVCSITSFFDSQFFGVDNSVQCLVLKEIKSFAYQVFSESSAGVRTEIGEVKLVSTTLKDMSAKPGSLIHLPSEQQVFSLQERFLNSFMIGPLITDIGGTGVFTKLGSHKPQHLYMEIKPESLTFVGVSSMNRPEPVLVYAVPTLLKYQLPL